MLFRALVTFSYVKQRALTSLQKTMGFTAAAEQQQQVEDVEMAPEGGLPPEVESKVMETMQACVICIRAKSFA